MPRKKISVLIAAALAAGGIATAATTNASASTAAANSGPQLVSVDSSGSSIDNVFDDKISDDGRWVAFSTYSPYGNGIPVVYVRDLAHRTTKKIYSGKKTWEVWVDLSGDGKTLAINATTPIGSAPYHSEQRIVDVATGKTIVDRTDFSSSYGLSLSSNGQWAALTAYSSGRWHVYLWNIAQNKLTVISPANSDAYSGVISPDAKKVAYSIGDNAYSTTLATGARQVINVNSTGGATKNGQANPQAYSADDNYVLFYSESPDYGYSICWATCAFRRDLRNNTVTPAGVLPNGHMTSSYQADLSADGDVVTFADSAGNSGEPSQVYTRRFSTRTTTLNSKNAKGVAGYTDSTLPSITADGKKVTFISTATNLGTPTPTGGLWLTPSGV
ncbi:MAG: PD40 domain-containing protein [Mycobacterium sp.]|nr:PD40 domain-containing protein [Mycobacterium sp.]